MQALAFKCRADITKNLKEGYQELILAVVKTLTIFLDLKKAV